MAKGADAKIDIANRIAKALGDDWIGEVDKKFFFPVFRLTPDSRWSPRLATP